MSKHLLLSILDEKPKELKATLRTLKRIEQEFGTIPDKVVDENNNFMYDTIVKLYQILMEQEGIEITEEQIKEKVHAGNIVKIVDVIRKALTPDIPEELLPPTNSKKEG